MTQPPVPPSCSFVVQLQQLAATRPDDVALLVVGDSRGEVLERGFRYGEFEQRVRALAACLQRRLAVGDRALLLLDNDEHYAFSLLACFYAGVIAVPLFRPESTRPRHLARLSGVASDAQARGILTLASDLAAVAERFAGAEVIAVDDIDSGAACQWAPHAPASSDIAFLQYTSGSTSAPKGVMVSHANLMANELAMQTCMQVGPHDKYGVWAPLFHDMGLIGGLLQPFFSGIPCVLTSPRYFLERPVRWLELISRHRVTISGGPDFAYRLCVDRVQHTPAVDLSSWRLAYTGAEPVRPDTMTAFVNRYAQVGFRADAVYPCYGLAEATLFVTGGQSAAGMQTNRFCTTRLARGQAVKSIDGATLVACGRTAPAHDLRIVDSRTDLDVEHGGIGEIWTAGPSIALGYWGKTRETAETFVERDGRRWLRTGDLGFLHEGQLHVAGRIKDMIIVRGHNVYPQDLERAVEADVQAVRKGRVAAFGVDCDGEEVIGIAAEVSRGMQKRLSPQVLVDALSMAVSEQCGAAPQVIALLNPGALPKTTSGKLQRSACRKACSERSLDAYALYERGRFVLGGCTEATGAPDASDVQSGAIATELSSLWRDVLGHEPTRQYPGDAHFFSLGGNSLAAVQLAARIGDRWQVDFPPRRIFEQPRLQDVTQALQAALSVIERTPRTIIPRLSTEHRAAPLPLSHAQERQWFSWQLDPHSSAYHIALSLQLEGALDESALRRAFDDVIESQEALRTVFRATADGTPVQQVQAARRFDLAIIDLGNVPEELRERHATEHAQRLQREPFDLTCGPLLRAALLRGADNLQRLVIVVHHIASDGASMQLLLNELAARYAMHARGSTAQLGAPQVQYVDYALWHREWLAREGGRQLAWWREQLGGTQPVLALHTDHPRKAKTTYRARRCPFELPGDLLARLNALAQTQQATLFTMLLSALQVLLYRYTGQRDVRVGVPVANRPRAQTADIMGLFVNTLVLRNVLHARMSLADAATRAKEALLDAQRHQDVPFEQLVQTLQPGRSLSHNPLVQVTLNYLQMDCRSLADRLGVRLLAAEVLHQAAHFDLTFEIVELADGHLKPCIVYCEELFEPETIDALAGHYLAVLRTLAEQPHTSIADVPILDEAERARLMRWAGCDPKVPAQLFAHQLFERHAALVPEALAVAKGDVRMTYRELNRAANALAHRMIRLGIAAESRVGIATERSMEMLVCLLATLKAGAAYVPLDPAYPPQRLAYMLQHSGIALLLTQRSLRSQLPAGAVPVLCVDEAPRGDVAEDCNPGVALHEQSLAYVIYTSGSTGAPKGVEVAHGPLARHLQAISQTYAVDRSHRELFFFSLSFDAAVEQWMTPLCGGGAVVLCDPQQLTAEGFVDLIAQHRITTLHVPPAYLRVVAPLAVAANTRIRTCIVGGEALTLQDCELAQRAFAAPRIVNAYGPTETIVTPAAWVYEPGVTDSGNAPIGRPVAGRRVYVLDENLNLVPRGVAGELYVGGVEIARGYAGRAGLTAERFVADPFDPKGGRLYRTGDGVRWHAAGHLEYLGRSDRQVKVRGFRIELGEIEAQLLAHPGVREAVAVVRSDGDNERIDAYICTNTPVEIDALRSGLRERLPDYILPHAVVVLDRLPLTPNGKVDRDALPVPLRESCADDAPPSDSLEAALAAVWADVLGTPQITRHANFFDLGGHSLALLKVHSGIRERLGLPISLVDLFQHTTVAALAAFLKRETRAVASDAQDIQNRAARQRSHFIRRPATLARPSP